MSQPLTVLYRGPLSSCNYGCAYCPFAKHHETAEEHAADARALERFLGWCEQRPAPLSVFFTPWGEALTQPRYQQALARLSRLPHLRRVAIQTNLSARLDFLSSCEPGRVGVWATFHPEWARRDDFLAKVRALHAAGAHVSVGLVGFPRFLDALHGLRRDLPPEVYLWVNAVKDLSPGYTEADLAAFTRVDPLFPANLKAHPSLGKPCRAGHTAISVDGEGTARRCHFLREPIGKLYQPGFEQALQPRPCTAATCRCHIGYVHLEHLGLEDVYGEGLLERVPERSRWPQG